MIALIVLGLILVAGTVAVVTDSPGWGLVSIGLFTVAMQAWRSERTDLHR